MVVEELIAKLGFKGTGSGEVSKFLRELERVKKATKEAGKGFRVNFTGSTSGLGKITTDAERAARAFRSLRVEAERASRVRFRGGLGGGVVLPGHAGGRQGGRAGTERGGRGGGGAGHGSSMTAADAAVVGAGLSMGGPAGVAAGGAYVAGRVAGASLRSSMSFERSMIEVEKATDATDEEAKEYEKRLLRLARDTGKPKEDVADLLTQAARAGRPKAELMRFTEYGAKATTAWGTTGQETGDALAYIGNIYQTNQEGIEKVGDQINYAADATAASERDLLSMVRRSGGSAATAGMSSGDYLGFSAGLLERGVQPEIAAGGIEDYINFLKLGEEYSSGAAEGLKKLGLTSKKLRDDFAKMPTKTALNFLQKIKDIKDPRKRAEILTGIFGKTRQDDAERLASSVDKIRENVEKINDPKNYRGTVDNQFAKQMKKDVSKLDQAEQQIDVLKKRLGDPLKRFLGTEAEHFNKALDYFEEPEIDPATAAHKIGMIHPYYRFLREKMGFNNGTSSEDFMKRLNGGHPFGGFDKNKAGAGTFQLPPALQQIHGATQPEGASKMAQAGSTINSNNTTSTTNTASVSVSASGIGLKEVSDIIAEKVKSAVSEAISKLGASVAKGNTTPTAPELTGP